ncbi:MAG: CAP domain-containing protein [Candidatus Saccharimonadales bacterium]
MKQKPPTTPLQHKTTKKRHQPLGVWGRMHHSVRRRVRLLLVPQKANQFRPHIIRRYGIMSVLVLVIGIQFGYNYSTTGRVLGEQQAISTIDLLADTNTERAKADLPPLQTDDRLTQAAYLKAQDMLDKQYLAHKAPDGTTPWYWFGRTGYNYAYAGENLAKNFATAKAATVAWMASPAHRENIMDTQYTNVGFAVVDGMLDGKMTSLIVAMYAEPAGNSIASVGADTAVAGLRSSALRVSAPAPHSLGVMARIGVAAESVSPAAVAGMVIVIIVAILSVMAHTYRRQLPRALRQSWYRHHGALKATGMLSLSIVMILVYSGGQI